ncbi:MAG: hypothetical protein EOP83_03515 [Verrucomicrobiaceae bacterium]|nr:MAG: hypothetical protein EOP83_03515 [Verrucomicrobiaceae bacterium]
MKKVCRWKESSIGAPPYPYVFHAELVYSDRLFEEHLAKVRDWCRDQFGGAHYGKSGGWHRRHESFYFSDPVQAFAFKVRWL